MRVREATAEDAGEVMSVYRAASAHARHAADAVRMTPEKAGRAIEDGRMHVVLTSAGKIVGAFECGPADAGRYPRPDERVATAEDIAGCGSIWHLASTTAASLAAREAYRYALARFGGLAVDIDPNDAHMRRILERAGFERAGRTPAGGAAGSREVWARLPQKAAGTA